jgi:uncharacterized protein
MRFTPLLSRRRFVQVAVAGLVGGGTIGLYANQVEPHWLEVVHQDMPVHGLPAALEGETLVQLSDIHVGRQVDDGFLRQAFDLVNGLEPAFVAITGDFMTCEAGEQVDHALKVLESLRPGRLGTVAILGNHDYGMRWNRLDVADRLSKGLRDQGLAVLRNERRTLGGLTFLGVDDLWSGQLDVGRTLARFSADEPAVALCHNPDGVDLPGWGAYRGWILSGHTHGGQCKAPFLTPPRLPVKNKRYFAGAVDLGDGRHLYINRALGHLLQVRFNVRPEVTAFRLTRA